MGLDSGCIVNNKKDKDNKNKIVDKDTVKAIIGRSPDYADCLAMRMYYEIDSNYGRYFVQ